MDHETFAKSAAATARNAQGIRPLAGQVRLLYDDIRKLQADDNSYFYIAEIIAASRGGVSDIDGLVGCIRVYHHRDRKVRGDKPIKRGSATQGRLDLPPPAPSPRQDSAIPAPAILSQDRPFAPEILNTGANDGDPSIPIRLPETKAAAPSPQLGNDEDRAALTHALRQRGGRRIVADAG